MILALLNAARAADGNVERCAQDAYARACEWLSDTGAHDLRYWFEYEIRCVLDFGGADPETCDWFRQWV